MLDTPKNGRIDYAGDVDYFRFTPSVDGCYAIATTGDIDTFGNLYNASGVQIGESNDDSGDGTRNFKIVASLTKGKVYYIKVSYYRNIKMGDYSLLVKIDDTNNLYPIAWPVSTGNNKISLQFGQIDEFTSAAHTGIDIQGDFGDSIFAAINGRVVYSGYKEGYGNAVYINGVYENKRIQVRYAHLQEVSVSKGIIVAAGTIIGKMGSSGQTAGGALLHFEALESTNNMDCRVDGSNAVRKNPLVYFEPIGNDDLEYLSNPFAVGKVAGDTFEFSSSAGASQVAAQGFYEDFQYNFNTGLAVGKAYLRKLVEKYAWEKNKINSQELGSRNILTWDGSKATVNLNEKIKKYGVALSNAYIENNRLVVDSQEFYDFFYKESVGISVKLTSLKTGDLCNGTINIIAEGKNCDHIAAFVNDMCVAVQNGNNFSYNYTVPYDGTYKVYVKARNVPGSSGGKLEASGIVTVQGRRNTIEPMPNPIPINTGRITVNGTEYNIYVPSYDSNNSNTNFTKDGWSTVQTVPFSSTETDLAGIIADISMEEIEQGFQEYAGVTTTQKFAAMSFIAGLIDAYKKNIVATYIQIVIQKKDNQYRAVVQFGTSNTELQSKAGTSYYYSDLKSYIDTNGVTRGKSEAQELVKNSFSWTDDDKIYDIKISLDFGHSNDIYMGYLSVAANGKLVFTPKLRAEDNEVIGHYTGFLGLGWEEDASMRNFMEMSGVLPDKFKTAVNGMIGTNITFLRSP